MPSRKIQIKFIQSETAAVLISTAAVKFGAEINHIKKKGTIKREKLKVCHNRKSQSRPREKMN